MCEHHSITLYSQPVSHLLQYEVIFGNHIMDMVDVISVSAISLLMTSSFHGSLCHP